MQVEITGIEEIVRKLEDPNLVEQPLKGVIKEASNIAKSAAMHNLSGGTGQAAISMAAKVEPMVATVYSKMPKARKASIEHGRKPGDAPTLEHIARWHTGTRTGRRNVFRRDLAETQKGEVVRIQKAMRMRGVKARKFIAGGAMAAKKALPRLMAGLARKVEERWSRK